MTLLTGGPQEVGRGFWTSPKGSKREKLTEKEESGGQGPGLNSYHRFELKWPSQMNCRLLMPESGNAGFLLFLLF